MDERTRKWLSASICDLRDTADRDYIAARVGYRLTLPQSSAWSASQAIEKYLKAILLFSYRPVKPYRSHDLAKLRAAVERLPLVGFTLPAATENFFDYLDEQGPNRYSDVPIYAEGFELFKLDRAVWHVRRYCQDFLLLPGDEQRYPGESAIRLAAVPSDRSFSTLGAFSISRGYLEEVVGTREHELRPHLIWKNRYWGVRRKGTIRYRAGLSIRKPVHVARPEIVLDELERLVIFPKDILAELRRLKQQRLKEGAV
jgi:HEPN domain-containing protein